MRKKNKHIIFLIVTFLLLVAVEYFAPKELDWTPTFRRNDKIPYGCYIMHDILPHVFPSNNVEVNVSTLYQLSKRDSLNKVNFIFINSSFEPNDIDTRILLDKVKEGSSAFIAANRVSPTIADTLNLSIRIEWLKKTWLKNDTSAINFVNPYLQRDSGYAYNKEMYQYYFNRFDTAITTVLGTNGKGDVNFIQVQWGDGNLYFHSLPLAFTNYNLLKENNIEYISKALAYLPANDIIWDEYHKPQYGKPSTPIRYILSSPPLKTAYIVLMVALVLYLLFEGKRRQRIIPVVKPPKNTSIEFTETVGRLYLHSHNHVDIVRKRLNYLLEYIRTKYYIDLSHNELLHSTISVKKIEYIHQKTGIPVEIINRVFGIYRKIAHREQLSNHELLVFSNMIEDFYQAQYQK